MKYLSDKERVVICSTIKVCEREMRDIRKDIESCEAVVSEDKINEWKEKRQEVQRKLQDAIEKLSL